MFAVVEINDKQHLVREGDILTIDGSINEKSITFDNVLLLQNDQSTIIGQPYVEKSSVEADVIETGKREKDIVFKFKRKTGYKVTRGHRQNSTLIKIKKIKASTTKKTTTQPAKNNEANDSNNESEK
jgi:large subunit ribosomal protein L21